MATGLLIRDFQKRERDLRYRNSGSIAISGIEINAYRLSLTLEITHLVGQRYSNLKTLPENTHYGYATFFRGSTVTDSIAVKYPKFRLFDIKNDGIWQYHQHTESIKIIDRLISEYGLSYHAAHLAITEGTGGVLPFPKRKGMIQLPSSNDEDYAAFTIGIEEISEAEPLGDNGYRAFPIASPFPDIVKFKSDLPVSFLFRLEAWYLVNPAVYIADNPTDGGDETEDEEEYPTPEESDDEGDFPPSSPIPSGSDPRDFGDGNLPLPPPPFSGGQCEGKLYRVNVQRSASVSPPPAIQVYENVVGPIRGIRVESLGSGVGLSRSYYLRHGTAGQEIALGALFLVVNGVPNNPEMSIASIETMDGSSDNCGDPPPVL